MKMNFFRKKRKYGHIISLGYNCEVSFQFFLQYHFVESALFAWANTTNCRNVINVLKNPDILLSNGLEKVGVMFRDVASGILFHGKDDLNDLQKIEEELYSRIEYLKQKFFKTAVDGKKNLYIFKYPSSCDDIQTVRKDILDLYYILKQVVRNDFDLLIILESRMYSNIRFDIDKIFIRRVKFFTPVYRVTTPPYDRKYFGKIFQEFCPDFELPKNKIFKFEEVN